MISRITNTSSQMKTSADDSGNVLVEYLHLFFCPQKKMVNMLIIQVTKLIKYANYAACGHQRHTG